MFRSSMRCAALCAMFTLVAQVANAQVWLQPQQLATRPQTVKPPKVPSAIREAAGIRAQSGGGQAAAEQIAGLADESWMNGWMLAGLGTMAFGAYFLYEADAKLQELDYDDDTGTYDTMAMWGAGLLIGGGVMFLAGSFFEHQGISITPRKGGISVSKTVTFGKKNGKRPAGHRR